MKTIRIVRLVSGEMVIGRLTSCNGVTVTVQDPAMHIALSSSTSFVFTNPTIIGMAPDGSVGMMPMCPWANPKNAPSMTFQGVAVCGEVDLSNTAHDALVSGYYQAVSGITLPPLAQVLSGDFTSKKL